MKDEKRATIMLALLIVGTVMFLATFIIGPIISYFFTEEVAGYVVAVWLFISIAIIAIPAAEPVVTGFSDIVEGLGDLLKF